ncbi:MULTISPECIES: endonuclease/exonuclease/phosphatase family protein [Clostridium]|jgi:maltose 6'-phosphate phosphatase|uniref:Maltose 6'-phosphate phosphatase n=1 Tax=Clostridium colicanis DSM 13634 TaxID=1121305 RepID=A0A151AN55_9CLOT|nr:endonuclease/exonuclease/phosphatase family protein [Clostridium colicanis]KYH29063.1 maltose 6'-phosphate phosphatase [Clostridium colicanis DSM 13634]
MKLLTLNCHSWMEENQQEKIKIIIDTILQKKYDIIALQEVNQSIDKKVLFKNIKEDNFALTLINELKKSGCSEYEMLWDFSHIGYDKYEEGVSIITKHKIEKAYCFFATKSEDTSFWKTRKIIGASLNIKGNLIDVYSCHLGWWNDEDEPFKEQAHKILERVNDDRLTFLMGDFNNNAFLRGEGYDYLIGKGMYDTYSMAKEKDNGVTVKGKIAGWNENKEDLRLDWILCNKKIQVKYSKVIFNGENRNVVSDHYGVEVKIEEGEFNG